MGRAASAFSSALDGMGHFASLLYHGASGDGKQVHKDWAAWKADTKNTTHPRTAEELTPEIQAPVVDAAPVAVDDNALALRRQRLLASAYGRSQTILDQPATSSALGGSVGATGATGATQLGG